MPERAGGESWPRARLLERADPFDVILEGPAEPDAFVRARAAEGDVEGGYWAHVWESSRVLGRFVAQSPLIGPQVRVLEIGCGLGLAGIVAALRGAEVILTDREPDAVSAAAENARLNGVSERAQACVFDWRHEPDPRWAPGVLLGADVLYKAGSAGPVGRLIARLGCLALISEPNRTQSTQVTEELGAMGLRVWSVVVRGGRILSVQG